ncbi:MAG: hypothetical protein M3Q29_17265 [Chloroflexota bacterium]|nr:hypothetical protein [Chloroflexota bacterium]
MRIEGPPDELAHEQVSAVFGGADEPEVARSIQDGERKRYELAGSGRFAIAPLGLLL